ncbi:hypothetical protein TNCV_503961 [Trichonephila clavipes]|nr:hypothetical protein TNCV_503961 [Trichonephila clavipes]
MRFRVVSVPPPYQFVGLVANQYIHMPQGNDEIRNLIQSYDELMGDVEGSGAPERKRLDFEEAAVRPLQRGGKTIVRPRSTADSELGRSGNGLSPDQR